MTNIKMTVKKIIALEKWPYEKKKKKKKKKKERTFEKKDSKKNTIYCKGKWRDSSLVYKGQCTASLFHQAKYNLFLHTFFSLEWYLIHGFFNPKKWPMLLKSCDSRLLFCFLWWFFCDIVLVMMENRAMIMLLEMRVLFSVFLV
jgi:hypothetical protein